MAKKQLSFAQKAAKKKGKSDIKYVKYVNSVRSEKTGQWRFNERMIGLEGGESLDAALKRIEEEKKLLNIELPDPDQATKDTESVEAPAAEVAELPAEETAESPSGDDKSTEEDKTDSTEETETVEAPEAEVADAPAEEIAETPSDDKSTEEESSSSDSKTKK